MSESEEGSCTGVQREQNAEVIQERAEARAEQEAMGEDAISPTAEERTVAKEKLREQEEEKVKEPKRKKAAKSKRNVVEFGIGGITKQVEKQTNYMARLEQVLQPLQRLATSLNVQSKMIKEINTSVKHLQREKIEIQKTIQKGKTRKK